MADRAEELVPRVIADIYELAGRLRRNAEALAQPLGQSQARWQVLSAASADRVTVPQLARRLGVARQNVQRVADILVADGQAVFEPNPDHKTSPHLLLTGAGRATLRQLTRNARAYYRELARSLSDSELLALSTSLRTFRTALELRENAHPRRP
jgi:DNA-binding MarR family transcriptional regulator